VRHSRPPHKAHPHVRRSPRPHHESQPEEEKMPQRRLMSHAPRGWRLTGAVAISLAACMLLAPASRAVEGSAFVPETRSPVGIVVSDQPLASEAGVSVLRRGGNALDAAVATVFALGVVQPGQCGLGGGVRVLYREANGRTLVFDGGAKTPAAATPTTIGISPGGIDSGPEGIGHRVVAVPGTVAGLAEALRTAGTISLADAVADAERLAREGFPMTGDVLGQIAFGGGQEKLARFPASASIFLHPGGSPYAPGERFVQSDLAWTLRRIAGYGADDFYRGEIARRIAAEMAEPPLAPGDEAIMTAQDLANYSPVRREPLRANYRGATVETVPPPMAGTDVIETLNLLQGFRLAPMGAGSADALHVWAEAQKIAEADTDPLTDPAFYPVPVDRLISPAFANERRKLIDLAVAKAYDPGVSIGRPRTPLTSRHDRIVSHTTHVSAIDRAGNAAAITCTLNALFGSGVVAESTGVLLNNGMRNGSPPGTPNQVEGNKFLATSVAPTIVVKDNLPILVLGAGGSAAIYRDVPEIISDVLDFGMDLGHAVDAERYHAYQDEDGPYVIAEQDRIPTDVLAELGRRGQVLAGGLGEYACCPPLLGIAAAAGIDPRSHERVGASDPRALEEDAAIGQ
jgi:gamma-glutamyltranspeptidase/glutathione hydrolase